MWEVWGLLSSEFSVHGVNFFLVSFLGLMTLEFEAWGSTQKVSECEGQRGGG